VLGVYGELWWIIGFFGLPLGFNAIRWVWTREFVSEFDGENVVFCWWGVVTFWFFDRV